VGAAPASQQQPQLAISVRAGFGDDNSYVSGEWFPVRVRLTNPPGAQQMRVRVETDSLGENNTVASVYAREVDLASPSRKDVTLYAYGTGLVGTFYVRVMRGDTTLLNKSFTVRALEQGNDTLVGVISSDASLLNVLRSERIGHLSQPYNNYNYGSGSTGTPQNGIRATVAHMAIDDLPAMSAGLNSLSALVVDDADTSALTPEQFGALRDWVGRGGTLVVAARPGGAELSQEMVDFLPVKIEGTRTLDKLDGLGDLVLSPITPTAPVAVTYSTLKTAPTDGSSLLAAQDGVPLVAMRTLGEGHVAYLALSPGLTPLKSWDGLVPLFKRLLVEYKVGSTSSTPGVAMTYGYGYSSYYGPGGGSVSYRSLILSSGGPGQIFGYTGSLFDLPVLDLPDPLGIAIFLFIYILIIGPINFIVLRRMRRAELAWLTIPALVLVFSAGAYLIGYNAKGGDLIMIRATTSHSAPGLEETSAQEYVGLFSPLRGNYKITVGGDALASEVSSYNYYSGPSDNHPARVLGGGTTSIDNVLIATSSLRGFMAENTVKKGSPLEADLRLTDNFISGSIRNRTTGGLQDVALLRGGSVQYIGFVGPGQSIAVKLPVSTQTFNNGSPSVILPTPPGFSTYSGGYSYGGQRMPPEVRAYNRKVNLLNVALAPLISNEAPTDMSVLALAWGGEPPASVSVDGHVARTEDINLWTVRLPMSAGSETPKLKAGLAPFWTYEPSASVSWRPGFSVSSLSLAPYADAHFSLPAGVKPEKLSLVSRWPLAEGVDLLAYNVRTGKWDRLVGPDSTQGGQQPATATLVLPSPVDYTGPAGDVTIRLLSKSSANVSLSSFGLALNE
jgi:hypothetical protein